MARYHLTGSLLCATALLSACGGGGSGNVASIPAPPVAVAATAPAPIATPTPASTFVPGAYKVGVNLVGPHRDKTAFDYDEASGMYRLNGWTYHPDDLSSTDSENGNFRLYTDDTLIYGDGIIVLVNSSNNTRISLRHLSYGLYFITGGLPFSDQPTVGALVFGTETPSGSMPLTGSATYQGIVDGVGFDSAATRQQRLLGSTGSLTANFATGSVSTSLSLRAPDFTGALSGSGTIGAGTSHFDGSLTGTLNGVGATGSFLGGFYGPSASEAGYVFNAWTGSSSNPGIGATGAFVGKQ